MDLREYERHKFEIADILRQMALVAPDKQKWRDRATALFTRLAEDRFNLVLVGRFSRGKSSLMNAMLGMARLPTGIVPLTSVITSVSYGTVERAVLHFTQSFMDEEVPLASLSKYVTQQGNPGNAKGIKEAEVQLPAEFLRRGFHFVDTPGLGSAIEQNTRTTEAYLSEADAFLLVTSFDSPLSEDEMRFFRAVASSPRRVFVVLNKQDTVSDSDRAEAMDFVRGKLGAIFSQDTPKVFSISALLALRAKQTRDPLHLEASGIVSLEQELVGFLLTKKQSEFLLRMCDRLLEHARGFASAVGTAEIVQRITELSRRIAEDSPDASRQIAAIHDSMTEGPTFAHLRPCEICASTSSALWEFQRRFQYEITVDRAKQRDLAERGGLCGFHTWQYHSNASPQGIAEGYAPVLENWAAWLRTAAGESAPESPATKLKTRLSVETRCVLCLVRAKAESEAIATLSRQLAGNNPHTLDGLSALCLPHLSALVNELRDTNLAQDLLRRHAALLDRVAEDLKRSALKHDGVRRYLLSNEEETASTRALALLVRDRPIAN